MNLFVCLNVFVPLRSAPSHKAEMLSQVLFGEKYRIIESIGHWHKIETIQDAYTGWIDIDHLSNSLVDNNLPGFVLNRPLACYKEDSTKLILEPGCEIFNPDFEQKTFTAGNEIFRATVDFSVSCIKTSESITETAARFMNSPYLWGGRIPSGIDCSGFVQLVYKIHDTRVPRDSWQQAEIGDNIGFIDETQPGDLAFFDDDAGRITHVGMIFSSGLVIHASGRVRIDKIDHQGIYKHEIMGYSHKLRAIRRIINH